MVRRCAAFSDRLPLLSRRVLDIRFCHFMLHDARRASSLHVSGRVVPGSGLDGGPARRYHRRPPVSEPLNRWSIARLRWYSNLPR